jgi:hypothetical protein
MGRFMLLISTLLLGSNYTHARYISAQECDWRECREILQLISGGNSWLLLLEIIGGSFVVLALVIYIYERWLKR